jgi:uncharacterized membrane protein YoaK (UPF0700 family)
MFQVLFKIWFTIAVLPFLIFLEGDKMLAAFLKSRNIYSHWDIWHSSLVVLIFALIVLWAIGF